MNPYDTEETPWEWVNDSPVWLRPRRTIYFLTRRVDNKREDFRDKLGRLRTWKTQEDVKAAMVKMNSRISTLPK